MAEGRLRKRDQQYDKLVQGSSKLHRDIENLENAYLLHQQIVKEDENNVKGMIRKELGGSRWAHGGAGKLTTYKSSKDLVDQENNAPQNSTRVLQSERSQQKSQEDNSKTKVLNKKDQSVNMDQPPDTADKILDLKTKVLKKASSNIIKRDTWSEPLDNKSLKSNNKHVSKALQHKPEIKNVGVKQNTSASKAVKAVKRSGSLKRETSDSSRSPAVVAGKCKENKQNKITVNNSRKEPTKTISNQNGVESQRRSRIDMFKDREVRREDLEHVNGVMIPDDSNQNNGNESSRSIGKTYTPRKLKSQTNARVTSDVSQSIFLTQPPEPPEIYIDPRKGQVRILAGKDESFNDISSLEGTKVLIQPASVHNSVDGNKVECSVVDNFSNSSPSREIRGIFGLEDFNTMPNRPESRRQNMNSGSPFATTRQCNTEVEFWLRSLGIPDVDKHVRIFADNGVDLTDLEFMSASQLHDMGVTAFGALDKILKGIRDLKNLPITQLESIEGKKLQTSSIAWEEVDSTKNRKSIERSQFKASNVTKKNSCHSDTFVKDKNGASVIGGTDTSRCNSAMSNVSESTDMKNSARGDNPSFAASTKSSSAKYTEKRPPSAKNNSKSKNSNHSQNKNANTSETKLKRNNSSASEKLSSKLNNLESKPTKGVLLRPRSSSLTRESSKNNRECAKKAEDKKEPRQLRSRSRSADVVKRKALEGVNAAAKKFEERKLKCKDSERSYPPCDEKQKLRRDEMAARHLQREKFKEMTTADGNSSDSEDDLQKQAPSEFDQDQGLENLVTVNILSPPGKSDPRVSSSPHEDKGKTQVMRPDMRRSLRRIEQARKLQHVKPLQLQSQSDIEPPLLSTYKITNKDRDKSQSEPESGYRTDASTTYSNIEDRVSDIQRKIRRLKSRATSGDDMTLTLVHDLQEQLVHFERQLKDKDRQQGNFNNGLESKHESSTPRTPKLSARRLSVDEITLCNSSPGSEQLDYSRGMVDGGASKTLGADVRMSKRELLDEMKKEKQQHHRQIRQLQCELQKFRHSDPVSSLELDYTDINYKPEDLIGEGTFSRVYKGEFKGSEVAVKQLKIPLQQADKNYFAAEVSLLKELRHPRVVLLIGVCTSGKLPVMVLEYMSHGSLFNYLHNPDCDSLDHALYYQISRDIALGMNYLHSHKPEVLHLDLKSMNVLLCDSLRAKIADFGFSKLRLDAGLRSGRKVKSKPSCNAVPSWMSPELLDKGEITGKSDVYSFGIILWEMLTRCSPYKDCSVFQVLEMVRKNKRPEIPDGTPEGLDHLIKLCWDPNPAKRPQFKDILQMLENLAFPPAWRELFQEAGVPESALHDVQSTRTIISLVTGTLDSGKSGILHSFLVAHTGKGNHSGRKDKVKTETTYRSEDIHTKKKKNNVKSSSRSSVKSSSRSSKISSLGSSRLGDWDSDTATSVSEKTSCDESTEFTLKNLRESSSENDDKSYSDESSILTSDDDNIYSKSKVKENVPKTEINVVIPNLELSLQSVRDEFRAERQKISKDTADWVYVSLDDRTDRSEEADNENKNRVKNQRDHNRDIGDMKLRLSSSLSNRSPTPPSPLKIDTSTLNESARSRRRSKAKDLNRYSEEYLMRESFDNRRPPSPVKKKSLTKKILENPGRQSGSENVGLSRNEDFVENVEQNQKIYSSIKTDSFAERSYDSFFDVSVKRPSLNGVSETQNEIFLSQRQASDAGYHNKSENTNMNEDRRKKEQVESTYSKTISKDNAICVEDMEHEVMSERNSDIKNHIDSDKSINNGQNAVNKTQMVDELTLRLKTQTPDITTDNISFRQDHNDAEQKYTYKSLSNKSNDQKSKEAKSRHSEFEKVDSRDNTEINSSRIKTKRSEIEPVSREVKLRSSESDVTCRKNSLPMFEVCDNRNGSVSSRSDKIGNNYITSERLITKEGDTEKQMSNDLKIEDKNIHKSSTNNELQQRSTQQTDTFDSLEIRERENRFGIQQVKESSECISNHLSKSLAGKDYVSPRGKDNDGIRVVLNSMLASRDMSLSGAVNGVNPESLVSSATLRNCTQMQNKSCDANNDQDMKTVEQEKIRVKLDLTEVDEKEKKKKPVITPRRSLMLSTNSMKVNEVSVNNKENASNAKSLQEKSTNDNDIEKSSIFRAEQEQKGRKSQSLDGNFEKEKKRDSGTTPKRRLLPKQRGSQTSSQPEILDDTVEQPKKLEYEIEKVQSPKKNTIRVTLGKDPLAPKRVPDSSSQKKDVPLLTRDLSSPIPPPPPPPPVQVTKSVSLVRRSVQNIAPRGSMADELKSRLNKRQSVSEGMLRGNKSSGSNVFTKQLPGQPGKDILVPGENNGAPKLMKISEMSDALTPQQSDGLPSFVFQSMELQDQKDNLRSISKPHPHQLDDLSNASQEQLTSIADILKKAVMGRRLAMKEDGDSVSQSLESAATGWSIDL